MRRGSISPILKWRTNGIAGQSGVFFAPPMAAFVTWLRGPGRLTRVARLDDHLREHGEHRFPVLIFDTLARRDDPRIRA